MNSVHFFKFHQIIRMRYLSSSGRWGKRSPKQRNLSWRGNPEVIDSCDIRAKPKSEPIFATLSQNPSAGFWREISNHKQQFWDLNQLQVAIPPHPVIVGNSNQFNELFGVEHRYVFSQYGEHPTPAMKHLLAHPHPTLRVRVSRAKAPVRSRSAGLCRAIACIWEVRKMSPTVIRLSSHMPHILGACLAPYERSKVLNRPQRLSAIALDVGFSINLPPSFWVDAKVHGGSLHNSSLFGVENQHSAKRLEPPPL